MAEGTHFAEWWTEQGRTADPESLTPEAIFNAGMAASGDVLRVLNALGDTISRATYEGTCSYHRQAYQVDNARITIDHDVRTLGRTLGMVVVEVKGETIPTILDTLLPPEDPSFGKRKWALDG